MTMLPPDFRVSCALFFLTGFAALSFEVVLTRLYALLLYQDFGFLAISFAMLGIGLGALVSPAVLKSGQRLSGGLFTVYGLSFPLVFFVLLTLPLIEPYLLWILFGICSLPPFILLGILAVYFYRTHPDHSGSLYSADILGAALGTLAAVAGMDIFDPYFYSLAVSLMILICAALLGWYRHQSLSKDAIIPLVLAIALAIICSLPSTIRAREMAILSRNVPGKALFDIVKKDDVKLEKTVWNSVSRVDLVATSDNSWKSLYSDAAVPATMFRMESGGLESVIELKRFIGYAPFTYGSNKKVLSIGCGGGLDCILSKFGGAESVTAVEVNGAMVDLIKSQKSYNGGVLEMDGVKTVVAEGRSYLRASKEKYDDILFLLTQGNSAEAGGRVTLENYLMTEEAYEEYYDHLNPGGKFVIATHNIHRATRHLVTWTSMLKKKKGIGLPEAVRRFAFLSGPDMAYRFLLIFHHDIPDSTDMLKLQAFIESTESDAIYLPFTWENDPNIGAMAKGTASMEQFIEISPKEINIDSVTDNKPFQSDVFIGLHPSHKRFLYWAMAIVIVMSAFPFSLGHFQNKRKSLGLGLLYFALLGSGFMIVEIVLMRKMMLYLGYPAMSLAVVLFAILLSAGVGGVVSQRFSKVANIEKPILLLLVLGSLLLIYLPVTVVIMDAVMDKPLIVRAVAAIIILAVPGFLMGIPFPTGLAITGKDLEKSIPWMWAINGVSGVFGSLATVGLALTFGLNATMLLGGVVYLTAALTLSRYQKSLA